MSMFVFSILQSTNTFLDRYRALINSTFPLLKETAFSATTFDAVYAAALTMKNALPELDAANLTLESFTFENSDKPKEFALILEKYLINVSFTGVSVSMQHHLVLSTCIQQLYV